MIEKNKEYYINRIITICSEMKFKVNNDNFKQTSFDIGNMRLTDNMIHVYRRDKINGAYTQKIQLTKAEYDNLVSNICIPK